MKKFVFIVLFLLYAQSVFPVTSDSIFSKIISTNLPAYYFDIRKIKSPTSLTIYTVTIYKDSINNLLQVIKDSIDGDFNLLYPEFSFEFIDINFDGYQDLKFFDFTSPNGQSHAYKYWLFNNETGKFIYNENYSYKLAGIDVCIDSSINMIIVYFKSGDYAMGQDRYKVINNELILSEEEGIFYDITKEAHFERLYRNVNGEMIIIREKPFSFKE